MDIEKLYNDTVSSYFFKGKSRILFRGFLLEKKGGYVCLMDTRNPYYKIPTTEDLNILFSMGFYNGATYLLMKSDEGKIKRYKELIKKQGALLDKIVNPRKKQEYLNTIGRFKSEIEYYESQVGRWQKILKK